MAIDCGILLPPQADVELARQARMDRKAEGTALDFCPRRSVA
jgi:hypothetical protein